MKNAWIKQIKVPKDFLKQFDKIIFICSRHKIFKVEYL